jgi:hypothetical protein
VRNTYAQACKSVGALASLHTLCAWWTQAAQKERFECLRRTIHGDPNAPPLKTLQLAIYLAEVEAGEVSEG